MARKVAISCINARPDGAFWILLDGQFTEKKWKSVEKNLSNHIRKPAIQYLAERRLIQLPPAYFEDFPNDIEVNKNLL